MVGEGEGADIEVHSGGGLSLAMLLSKDTSRWSKCGQGKRFEAQGATPGA